VIVIQTEYLTKTDKIRLSCDWCKLFLTDPIEFLIPFALGRKQIQGAKLSAGKLKTDKLT
jgi:hypothetical protein